VLSGIAATGTLHIGNYVGALSVWADEQDRYDKYFMIDDLHALTIPENVQPDAQSAGTIRDPRWLKPRDCPDEVRWPRLWSLKRELV
jgi:hypothetical protein